MPALRVGIKLDGRALDEKVEVTRLEVASTLDGHHHARVTLVSSDLAELQEQRSAKLDQVFRKLGKQAEVQLGISASARFPVFKGFVRGGSHERATDGTHRLTLALDSPTVLLEAGPRSRIWEKKSPKDIATAVLSRAGQIPNDLGDLPTTEIPYEAQHQETDLEFLHRLASRHSVWLYWNGEKLVAKKSLPEGGGGVDLSVLRDKEAGRIESLSVSTRLNPGRFVESSFLPDEKSFVKQNPLQNKGSHAYVKAARQQSNELFKAFAHRPPLGEIAKEKQLQTYAESRDLGTYSSFVEAQVTTTMPGIRPGIKVKIDGTGGGEAGDWLVVGAWHTWDANAGYRCEATMIPVEAAYPPAVDAPPGPVLSRAQVDALPDRDHPGMVRVKFARPVEDGGGELEAVSAYARVASPHAGEKAGFASLPEIGDEVLVGHVGGRGTHPIVLGSLYSTDHNKAPVWKAIQDDTAKPDLTKNEGKAFFTRSKNMILFVDSGGKEAIEIRNEGGKNRIRLTLDGPKIEVETQGDVLVRAKKEIKMQAEEGMTLETKKKMTLKAMENLELNSKQDIVLNAMQNVKISSKQNTEIAATASFKADGTGGVEISGTTVKVTGKASTEVGGNANLALKSSGILQIQGSLVKIN